MFFFSNNLFCQVDRLEDELVNEQDKFKAITEEVKLRWISSVSNFFSFPAGRHLR